MKKQGYVFNSDEVLFTSDTHFNHKNIISLSDRPFADVEEMNEALVENWNSIVLPGMHVFHEGDFALGGKYAWNNILPRLNGIIHLVMGNHDYQNIKAIPEDKFASIHDQIQITVSHKGVNRALTLNHYPLLTWGGIERGVWNLHGHWHTTPAHPLAHRKAQQYDVGVDNNGFKPISFEKVDEQISIQIAMWEQGEWRT